MSTQPIHAQINTTLAERVVLPTGTRYFAPPSSPTERSPLLAPLETYGLVPAPVVCDIENIALQDQSSGATILALITDETASGNAGELGDIHRAFVRGIEVCGWTEVSGQYGELAATHTVELHVDSALPSEGYRVDLQSGARRLSIAVAGAAAAQHSAITLAQLVGLQSGSGQAVLEGAIRVEDNPRFAHRGVMLDLARSYFPPAVVRDLISLAAQLKLNVVHLHLVDDQAWRVEITNEGRSSDDSTDYTRLHTISGQTAVNSGAHPGFDSVAATTASNPVYGDPNKGFEAIATGKAGYYTQNELRDLVAYAKSLGIAIVPELEFPGHNHSVLHAMPELATKGAWTQAVDGQVEAWTRWQVGYSYLDYDNAATWRFAEHVMRQYGEIFGFDRLHLGGDECYKLVEDLGQERYNRILSDIVTLAHTCGFARVTLWQEGVLALNNQAGGNDAMQLWNYTDVSAVGDLLAHARETGAHIINSDARHLYLDQKINLSDALGLTWAVSEGLPTRNTYEWDPLADIPTDLHGFVDGIEACLWGETIRTAEDIAYLTLPRLASIAEVAWLAQENRAWQSVSERIGVSS